MVMGYEQVKLGDSKISSTQLLMLKEKMRKNAITY